MTEHSDVQHSELEEALLVGAPLRISEAIAATGEAVSRAEVASLCGLILRRLQELVVSNGGDPDGFVTIRDLNAIFGEALHDFAATKEEPGE